MSSPVNIKQKIMGVGFLFGLCFFVYIVYLFSLQVVRSSDYKKRVTMNIINTEPIPTRRGEIFDRNFTSPLVINVDSYIVEMIPAEFPTQSKADIIKRLASLLVIKEDDINKIIRTNTNQAYALVTVEEDVSYDKIIYLSEHQDEFPGIYWKYKPIRKYLETGSIAHIVGYVGDITNEEWRQLSNKSYSERSILGKAGVEKFYDEILRGKEGVKFLEADAKGKAVQSTDLEDVAPELGKNIVLTIDMRIQALAEKALGERRGSVIVLKPSTGEIMALVSYPFYNPNYFYTDEKNKYFSEYYNDKNSPFLNRAIQATYPPASTFKVIMSTAIYEENLISENQKVYCEGLVHYGGRDFKCWEPLGHGYQGLHEALANSCDVYYYTVGRDNVGIQRISGYARTFGFGMMSGIDLPQEQKGLVPDAAWKESVIGEKWQNGDTMNSSIGQGFLLVTPIQLANMAAMVVNNGIIYKPHLLKEIRDPVTGQLLEESKPEILSRSGISSDTFKNVRDDMRLVVTNGTAMYVMSQKAVEVAAKTGTGEVGYEKSWHSWFVAFAPYQALPENQLVVLVSVEASGKDEYEWWAPKAANIILQGIFANQTFDQSVETLGWQWLFNNAESTDVDEGRVD